MSHGTQAQSYDGLTIKKALRGLSAGSFLYMPNYDYVCADCSHLFETFHSMSESPVVKCPQCGSESTQKQMGSGAGIVFKGSGFYVTDYKKSASNKPASSSDTSPKKSSASPGVK